MKKSIRDKWVKALRSGKYQQAREELYAEGLGHCCLGVLRHCVTGRNKYNDKDEHTLLSLKFCDRVGLAPSMQGDLAALNDDGQSFDQIADYIQEHL